MKYTVSSGNGVAWEEGAPYDVIIKSIELDNGQFGEQVKFVLQLEEFEGVDMWVWCAPKLGKSNSGKVAKLRGIANAVFDKPEKTEIEWFESDDLSVKYKDEKDSRRLTAGMRLRAKGEFQENSKGEETFRFIRFAPAAAKAAVALGFDKGDVNPDDIPF